MNDESYMKAALRQAAHGVGRTSPNPAVGALIVRGGKVLGRGYHQKAGGPHAEIEALRAIKTSARGATLYVTLEPCSTHGRTPPCVDAIIAAGITRVVIGTMDPNPAHAGRAVPLLEAAGIQVSCGVCAAQCSALNRAFNKWIVSAMPLVIAKAGMSLDGRIARPPGEGQWLTSEASRQDAMKLRSRVDAILIGANTLRTDNPRLTIRTGTAAAAAVPPVQPWRVIVAGERPLPADAHVFTDEYRDRTLVYHRQPLEEVLRDLGRKAISSVLIEGGMRVLGEAFDRRLVDEVQFYLAPLICGGPTLAVGGLGAAATSQAPALHSVSYRRIGSDLCLHGFLTE